MQNQQTVSQDIELIGKEAYGGCEVEVSISPSKPDTGIIFDLSYGDIPARLEYAKSNAFSILLEKDKARLLCSEHLLANLKYGCDIDNAIVKVRKIPSKSFEILQELNLATKTQAIPYNPNFDKTLYEKIRETGTKEQNKKRKILRLEEKINTGELIFIPKKTNELVIKAITYYEPIGEQERTIPITPETYNEIVGARGFCKFIPGFMPESISRFFGGILMYPTHGLGTGVSSKTSFRKKYTIRGWEKQEKIPAEISCHKIVDLLGALSLLDGKLEGTYIECQLSGHKNDLAFLNRYKYKFKEKV